MNDSEVSDEDARAIRLILTIVSSLGIIVGAVVGAIAFYFLGKSMPSAIIHMPIYGCVCGAFVGGAVAFVKTRAELHRQHELHVAGTDLGLVQVTDSADWSPDDIEEIEDCIRELIPSDGLCTVRVQFIKDLGFATFAVAEVSVARHLRQDDHTISQRCTVAYFGASANRWPSFTMTPESSELERSGIEWGIGEASATHFRSYRSTKVFDFVFGDHDIDFPDSPVFSDNYHLLAIDEPRVRRIYSAEVRDYFSQHPGWCVSAHANVLIAYDPLVLRDTSELKPFVENALQIGTLFSRMDSGSENVDGSDEDTATDIRNDVDEMPGLLGHVLKRRLVTNDEIEEFLAQPIPRRVPGNIKRQFYGFGNLLLILFGFSWTIGGISFVSMATAFGEDLGAAGTVAKSLAMLLVCIGAVICWINLRSRFFHRRLLRKGEIRQAVVAEVNATGTVVNNHVQYRMEVSLNDNPAAYSIVYGPAGRLAKKIAGRSQPTRFLVDPAGRSDRVIWVNSLVQGV